MEEVRGDDAAYRPLRRLYTPEHISLRRATERDDRFLYTLLEERYRKESSNIDGMARPALPSFEEHRAHLRRRPYRRIEVVVADDRDAGMMYLTRDDVGGCFILDAFAGRGLALSACFTFFTGERFPIRAHFNAANRAGWRTADRLGWTLVAREPHRFTYELRQDPIDPFTRVRRSARAPRTGESPPADRP